MPHLEKWAMLKIVGPYKAVEQHYQILTGMVSDHPKLRDGHHIETSAIRRVEGDRVITASGSRYTLGEPHSDYEAKYPNARERVLKGESDD